MTPIIVAIIVGIVVYALIIALLPRRVLNEASTARSMLQKLEDEMSQEAAAQDSGALFREQINKATLISRIFFALPGSQTLYPRLLKAGLNHAIDTFFIACIVSVLAIALVLHDGGIWGVAAAFAITYLGAWMYINRRIDKRNQAFLNLFADALDMIVRSVRSGYPLNAAVRMVADNMQPPVSNEFKQVADETNYGSSLIGALQRLSQRIDEPDIRFFVVVLAVQQEVGGNLTEVLSNLSAIIRKRKHLRMKIRALTSEGRATAWVLGLLPVFEFVAIYMVAPKHLTPLFNTHLGNLVLLSAIGIVLFGFVIVRKMINIEV